MVQRAPLRDKPAVLEGQIEAEPVDLPEEFQNRGLGPLLALKMFPGDLDLDGADQSGRNEPCRARENLRLEALHVDLHQADRSWPRRAHRPQCVVERFNAYVFEPRDLRAAHLVFVFQSRGARKVPRPHHFFLRRRVADRLPDDRIAPVLRVAVHVDARARVAEAVLV